MTDDLIERVALAMFAASHDEPWEQAMDGDTTREIYRADARAAIAAMSEPTQEMSIAGANAEKFGAMHVWQAMVDAMMREGK